MIKNSLKYLLLFVFVFATLFQSAACTTSKAQEARLPDGMATALVPDLPLDGYLYIQQGQPFVIPGLLLRLPNDASIKSLETWIVPSESSENFGAAITFTAQPDAEAFYKLIPDRSDLWKTINGNRIYLVRGTDNSVETLKNTIKDNKFVSLKEKDKEAWDMIERLPGLPADRPIAAGFIRIEDRLINFVQNNTQRGSDDSAISNLKLAKINIAAIALYSTRALQIADFIPLNKIKEAGPGIILVAKSSYPGFVISTALGQAVSRLNIEKTEVAGKATYYTAVASPLGDKAHLYFNNSGQYIFLEGALDQTRSQQLHRWIWDSK